MSPIPRPGIAFLFAHPAHWLALGGGVGLLPAAGTWGTLLAWLLFPSLRQGAEGDGAFAALLILGLVVGALVCARTGRDLGVADHGAIVWDEMLAFWLILWIVPMEGHWHMAAFVLFRLFDIVKPPPVSWADRRFKSGMGVMLDDLLAAGWTLLVLALWQRFLT